MLVVSARPTVDEAFRAALPPGATVADPRAVSAALVRAADEALQRWPSVKLELDRFASHVARLAGDGAVDAVLPELSLCDLFLAAAAAALDPAAVAAVDRLIIELAGPIAAAARAPDDLRDEATQVVRALVLLPRESRPPAILDYGGRGPLGGWLRIVVTREIVRLLRRGGRELELGDALAEAPVDDPVLRGLKERYRGELAEAFRESLVALGARERTLLRYQLVDGLSIDEIGAIHRVHRATAARWLARVREQLVASTRERLAGRLRLDEAEVASIIRLVRSQLDVSIVRHLG